MKIDEKIQKLKTELIKVLTESSGSREDAIQILEKTGLTREMISKIMESFIHAENAKNVVKSVWESDTRIDSSTDVATYQQQESETRQKFDDLIEASSILIIVNKANLKEISEEIWQKLYAQGIDERQITSPVLRKDYHAYVERTRRENNPDILKLKGLLSRVLKQAAILKKRCVELDKENEDLKAENERLKKENEELKRSNQYLETKFKRRIVSDEKHYQSALEQIKRQKREIRNLQNRSVFQAIGAKLFGNKTEELPEPTLEIPTTLYESIIEQVSATGYVQEKLSTNKEVVKNTTIQRTNDEELQQ